MTGTATSRLGYAPGYGAKQPCDVATAPYTPISRQGFIIVNGYQTEDGDRVLDLSDPDPSLRGIYIVSSDVWQRAGDWDASTDVRSGQLIPIANGELYQVTFSGDFVIDETEPAFGRISIMSDLEEINVQSFVATEGQTVFNLTDFTYTPNTKTLWVFVNGVKQNKGVLETDADTVTLTTPRTLNDDVEIMAFNVTVLGVPPPTTAENVGTDSGRNAQDELDLKPQVLNSIADLQASTRTALTAMAATILAFYGAATGAMGGGDFSLLPAPVAANNVTIFNDASGRSWQRDVTRLNVRMSGAKGDGVTNDRVAIQLAIDYLASVGGGELYFPRGTYLVDAAGTNYAALWVSTDNITFVGDGAGSIIRTTNDKDTAVHVSSERDLTVTPAGATVNNFTCEKLNITGTGHYTNYGLAFGRGILLRKVKNASITRNYVFNMSMIGIVTESGAGNFDISGNIIGNCKYGSINYNGRAYQSIVSRNICYGSDASINSAAIQVDGHCLVEANSVFGSLTNFANAGGIMWGEGAYYGVGIIRGNLVKHCRFGIKTIYHGPCVIEGNSIINCLTTGGINLVGGTSGGFTTESQDNLVANNFCLNCSPYNIDCSSPNTVIQGNKGVYQAVITNPSANTEPDYIVATGAPQADIRVTGASCSINFNTGRAATRGIIVGETAWATIRNVQGNEQTNTAAGIFAIESASTPGTMIALTNLFERTSQGGGVYRNVTFGNTKPSQGLWGSGARWDRSPGIVGSSLGETVVAVVDTTAAGTAIAGAVTLDVAATVSAVALNTIGIKLDNGAWHWTSVTAYAAPTMTIAAPIPAGRSVAVGARVYQNQWRALTNL